MSLSLVPHLWFDTQAVEAATWWASRFPDSEVTSTSVLRDTPSGDCDVVAFRLWGLGFAAISAGPLFRFSPAVSFHVACEDAAQVDALWAELAAGGQELMPLGTYPWSERYGWCADRYGVSWQLSAVEGDVPQRITPSLLFTGANAGRAEEALTHWASVFDGAEVGPVLRHDGSGPDPAGTVARAEVRLAGTWLAVGDSAHDHGFGFDEAVSLLVTVDTQDELDRISDALSADPEAEMCGWLKDRFGVSWQVNPRAMDELLSSGTPEQVAAVTEAFLQMKRFDIAALEAAARAAAPT